MSYHSDMETMKRKGGRPKLFREETVIVHIGRSFHNELVARAKHEKKKIRDTAEEAVKKYVDSPVGDR